MARIDYPPLYPAGFHRKSLLEIRQVCVDGFKDTQTRNEIMVGLETVVKRLSDEGIIGEIWVNGSFVTQKIDPKDVDILLIVDGSFYDNATQAQRDAIAWVDANQKDAHKCDSRAWMRHDRSHPDYWDWEWWRAYFLKLFGFYDDFQTKGIILITLPLQP